MARPIPSVFRVFYLSLLLVFFIAALHSGADSYTVDLSERYITDTGTVDTHAEKSANDVHIPKFTYTTYPDRFFCEVKPTPPLFSDVLYTIKLLRNNSQRLPACHSPHGGSGVGFCTTLSHYRSASIAICSTSRGLVSCPDIAWIAAALLRKCETIAGRDHRFRTAGLVRMTWGYIIVFNNAFDPHALGRVWGLESSHDTFQNHWMSDLVGW